MRRNLYASVALVPMAVLSAHLGWAQGATTSAMNGVITDKSGAGLPGATVIAVHTPTNTQYVAPTNSEGRFNIQGMRVGGPYTVRVTFIGYADAVRENITLSLGQNQRLDINLSEATQQLNEVVVSGARDEVINSGRTGAATSVSREQIQRLPTLNRSLQDFIRVSPQASGGGSSSLGGANNRYNNITIDGAVNNDVFGLAGSGTPGGQSGTAPISLDAIQELQIVLAPYDVTLGNFTGGGINAVTRSGTNDLSASIYGFGRNQSIVGRSVTDNSKAAEFYNYQSGARVGGAIVKDKVFFFLNAEISRRSEPLSFVPGSTGTLLDPTVISTIASTALSRYGYDVGTSGEINRLTESNKIFGRLDFNLSENHQLTVRHNFVKAFDDNISRTATALRFGSNSYKFNNVTNSSVAELNSRFGTTSNKLLLSYSRIRDTRGTPNALFPTFEINQAGNRYTFGTERSSGFNELDQDIFEFTDNVTKAVGKHTLTLGTHNEFFKFRNLFINNGVGYYQFPTLDAFLNSQPNRLQAAYAKADNGEASFSAMQMGIYAQDEFSPVENLRLTLGVRVDAPFFFDKPPVNEGVSKQYGSNISTKNTPNGQLLWAPRLGFNWDVNNDTKIQVRGGTGIFTGRVPFVWISNSFTNSGLIQGAVDAAPMTSGTGAGATTTYPPIVTDPAQIPSVFTSPPYRPVATSEINVLDKDFKLPQVWRTNLAVDFRLPGDVVATLEGIYTKTLNDIYYQNINLVAPVGRLAGPDQRPVYANTTNAAERRINQDYTNVLQLQNTNKGYRYNATAQLQKQFKSGLNTSVAYTYGVSKEVNSGASSTALSNWQFNQVQFDPNNPELGYSVNDRRHRILATGGYTFRYAGDKLATNISVIYEGLAGSPIAYVYGAGGRDLNNDGAFTNDLIYIPRDVRNPDEIRLVVTPGTGANADKRTLTEIQDQLDAFIENDPYLRKHRGQYAERFAARTPWTQQVDIRVAQDFNFMAGGKKNTLQVSFDIQNVGNLINDEWGRQYSVSNNAIELLRPETIGGNNVRPTFSFPATFAANKNVGYNIAPFNSRWQGQLGVRYSFN
ncbi:TonB-dependent Receptor Plug Domain [Hymenobacter gelipurpurascens]|uniref:TonB-dependent Receptor Plug Domain n=1 Tax=Hymenobacter gelipurpurascens TaxID=89968 RepID=A0A212TPE5_9BACT|nr:carboxypeptidase regulatory-like domain-containing protein [Hymenobacter gelipurpurascens]SNC67790.1 TonB-dependent Receptor Plug Domain [Hymenobacter gelipurpurascens]